VPQAWNPQPWASPAATPGFTAFEPVEGYPLEEPPAPARKRRWLKRTLLSTLVLLVIAGLVGGSLAYLDHRREVQHKKEVAARIAAEKKAEAAYLAAVKPLAIRVFDAVQPIQDTFDAFRSLRPGLSAAREDVILHGGAAAALAAVREALAALKAPTTQTTEVQNLQLAAASLSKAVKRLRDLVPALRKPAGSPAFPDAVDAFSDAESEWGSALRRLQRTSSLPSPYEERAFAYGRKVQTLGGYILAAELVCGRAEADLCDLRHPEPKDLKNLPREAKVLRTAVAELRKIPVPASKRALGRRLDVELQSTLSLAVTEEKLYAAYKKRDYNAYKRALQLWDEQDAAFRRVDSTYRSLGITTCTVFFGSDDDKPAKKSLNA
jgi:hypothetical protein